MGGNKGCEVCVECLQPLLLVWLLVGLVVLLLSG